MIKIKEYDSKVMDLEKKIGYTFNNKSLILLALTHSSYSNHRKAYEYNERLEFLGDSVLQLCISEYLFNKYKDKLEGELTKIRSLIVCENSLLSIAKTWNVGKYIFMGKGEELTGGRERVSILADSVESLIAAIYLDSNLEEVRNFILNKFSSIIDKAVRNKLILDYKTKLQEILQQNGEVAIDYNLVAEEGPAHRRKFCIEVKINDIVKGKGEGFSKKEAEQNAAKEALEKDINFQEEIDE